MNAEMAAAHKWECLPNEIIQVRYGFGVVAQRRGREEGDVLSFRMRVPCLAPRGPVPAWDGA